MQQAGYGVSSAPGGSVLENFPMENHTVQTPSRWQSARHLAPLLPAEIATFETTTAVPEATLTRAERALVSFAVPKRVREFATGRWCARQALSTFGIGEFSLLADSMRAPIWPAGIVGSLTHVGEFCAAAVGRSDEYVGIGIDAENDSSVGTELWRDLFTSEEIAWLLTLPDARRDRMATMLFSAKESFFKCQYSFRRAWLDFTAVRLEVEGGQWRVRRAIASDSLEWIGDSFTGRFAFADQLVFTAIAVCASQLK